MKTNAMQTSARTILLVVTLATALQRIEGAVTLYNPGFTNGSAGDADSWTENTLDEAARQSWGSHDGDGWLMSLPAYNSGTYGEFFQDVTNITPGYTYALSFWQEGDGAWNGSNVTARLLWLTSASNQIGSVASNLDAYTAGSVSWTNLFIDGTAPSNAAILRVQFDAASPSGGSGAAKVDDLSLAKWSGLLYNPSFAEGSSSDTRDADYWIETLLAEASRQNWGSHDGDGWLMSLPGYAAGTHGEFYQDVEDIGPGDFCTLSFWQEGDAAWNGSNVTVRLVWLDSESTAIGSVTNNLDAYTGGSISWTNLSLSGMAPADTVRLRVQFDADSPSSGGGAAKFDDLSLSRNQGGSLFMFR